MTLEDLLAVARGDRPADVVLTNVRLVDVFSGEVLPTDLALAGGKVAGFGSGPEPGLPGEGDRRPGRPLRRPRADRRPRSHRKLPGAAGRVRPRRGAGWGDDGGDRSPRDRQRLRSRRHALHAARRRRRAARSVRQRLLLRAGDRPGHGRCGARRRGAGHPARRAASARPGRGDELPRRGPRRPGGLGQAARLRRPGAGRPRPRPLGQGAQRLRLVRHLLGPRGDDGGGGAGEAAPRHHRPAPRSDQRPQPARPAAPGRPVDRAVALLRHRRPGAGRPAG